MVDNTVRQSDLRTKLAKAIQASKTTRFYQSVNLLWPNCFPVLTRVVQFVGDELRIPGDKADLLITILTNTRRYLCRAEAEGRIPYETRDRDYFVHFLHSISAEVSKVFSLEVSTEHSVWNPHTECFILWRRNAAGDLRVDWAPRGNQMALNARIKTVAEIILDPREVAILGPDLPRIWGDPPSIVEEEKEKEACESRPIIQ